MREIVLDTETTGLDPASGDRIVEIGCVELENHVPTGRKYQCYLNPEKVMSEEVIAVHGLTNDFLADKPKFSEVADEFLAFIGTDSQLVIHNAAFDMKFLNAELTACGREALQFNRVTDTLLIARQKFPGSRVNLNELCKRFNVDASARTVHGALLDSELLAEVYLELIGGREPGLVLMTSQKEAVKTQQIQSVQKVINKEFRPPRVFEIPTEEISQHIEFVKKIKNNLWGVFEKE